MKIAPRKLAELMSIGQSTNFPTFLGIVMGDSANDINGSIKQEHIDALVAKFDSLRTEAQQNAARKYARIAESGEYQDEFGVTVTRDMVSDTVLKYINEVSQMESQLSTFVDVATLSNNASIA